MRWISEGWRLGTVALSETISPRPDKGFVGWPAGARQTDFYTSVIGLGEIHRGIVMLAPSRRRDVLQVWFENDLQSRLAARVFDLDRAVALAWGDLGARGKADIPDALIGAAAAVHAMTVVTRNVRDFDSLGVPVVTPWT